MVHYVADHCVGYSAVLVRLSRVDPDALRDLLGWHTSLRPAGPRPARQRGSAGDGIARYLSRGAYRTTMRGGFLRGIRMSLPVKPQRWRQQ